MSRKGLTLPGPLVLLLLLVPFLLCAQDAPPPPDVPALFAKVKETLSSLKDLGGKPLDQAPLLKTTLETLKQLPPSTKYKGHRGEAIEAVESAIQTVNRLSVMSRMPGGIPANYPGAEQLDAMIDVALKETDSALSAWNGEAASAPAPGAASQNTSSTSKPSSSGTSAASPQEAEAMQSVVLIKGDEGAGTGFLVKMADGPCIVTNLHVLFANPNVKITTQGGDEIPMAGLKGASDRDLAVIPIADKGYKYLTLCANVSQESQVGDDLLTPGNSEGADVILPTRGQLKAVGTQKVEFSNPIYHGNSGGPVFDSKIGKVIGVVTQATKVNTGNDLDKASFNSQNSAITGKFRYFGFRIDSVPKWDVYDWNQFLAESQKIDAFHDRTRALHSYLSGKNGSGGSDNTYFNQDDQVRQAHLEFRSKLQHGGGSDASRTRAVGDLLVALKNLADAQVDDLQRGQFYGYNQSRAQDELEYRKWLQDQIDKITDSFDHQ